ncbi:MgtC/SapB family protein [Acidisoma cellulosilytica]|uniref:Protein MgtC n=1 Tax=Acidisoma cellulosilyticum TaxID=2802395 RepID=A0A963Z7E1_9PROT|nr:MgtC/SapB family protein [Acidisoma cellulosilyticum]MCB8883886.1 MgtC/SapB family protein [Acidisoma cellulosilyticum]
MPLHLTWIDGLVRLALTMLAAGTIGFDRGARGHAVGFRTTILVGLAAAVAMMQANMLLSVGGKTPTSFGTMDLMRLPLGILTGVGFIGGGAILRRGDLVTGVTTAATLWVVTVIGLCFGGGQLDLGFAASVLVIITLAALRWFEVRIPRERRARIVLEAADDPLPIPALPDLLETHGLNTRFYAQRLAGGGSTLTLEYDIGWIQKDKDDLPPDLLTIISSRYRILSFEMTSESHA